MSWVRRPAVLFLLLLGMFSGTGCSTTRLLPSSTQNHRKGFFDSASRSDGSTQASRKSRSFLIAPPHMKFAASHPKALTQFTWPLRNVKVTSPFGKRGDDFHEGVDLRAGMGTPVYAAQSGVVLYAGSTIRGYGKMIVVKHDQEIATIYAHNSKILV